MNNGVAGISERDQEGVWAGFFGVTGYLLRNIIAIGITMGIERNRQNLPLQDFVKTVHP